MKEGSESAMPFVSVRDGKKLFGDFASKLHEETLEDDVDDGDKR